jgi:hypothetical protein
MNRYYLIEGGHAERITPISDFNTAETAKTTYQSPANPLTF